MIIYKVVLDFHTEKFFFSKEDAERQFELWKSEGYIFFDEKVEEVFVQGNNPFLNNSELID